MLRFTFIVSLVVFFGKLYGQEVSDTMAINMDEFTFVGKRMISPDQVKLTNRDFKKLAASFDDPTRLLMHYSGFSASNDQANGIVFHGLPSTFFNWQLNGLDIINPNHLSNAGTSSDFSAGTSGGVNMMSGNVINNYTFQNAYSTKMASPSISGVSNISIDSLSNSYVQMSFLGLEAGLKKNWSKRKLFINYRYSFTGLLNNLGVKFGDENIKFQDFVLGYDYIGKKGVTKIRFVLGDSENYHPILKTPPVSIKDGLDIKFNSIGYVFQLLHDRKWFNKPLHLGFSLSAKNDQTNIKGKVDFTSIVSKDLNDYVANDQAKLTMVQEINHNSNIKYGIKEILFIDDYYVDRLGKGWDLILGQIMPYFLYSKKINAHFSFESKIGALVSLEKAAIQYIPSFLFSYENQNHKTFLSATRTTQFVNLVDNFRGDDKYSLANNFALNYQFNLNKLTLGTQLFYHNLFEIPVSFDGSHFAIDGYEYYNNLINYTLDGKINSYGSSVDIDYKTNDFWFNTNATVYSLMAKTDKTIAIELATSYKYIFNLNFGKDFNIKSNKLSISSSLQLRGRQRTYGIKAYEYIPIKNLDSGLFVFFRSYARLDLRLNYKMKKSLVSLDIQNAGNKLNYNFIRNEKDNTIVPSGALGLIPVITYKRWW